MLGKLLKYDLKYVFRYWWVLALTSIGAAFMGCCCIALLSIEELRVIVDEVPFLGFFAICGIMFSIFAICAFILVTEIFLFIRFYKHLFSDEGYLTFTLPVKRQTILNSKLLMALISQVCTVILAVVEIAFMFASVAVPTQLFSIASWASLWENMLFPLITEYGLWLIVFGFEFIVFLAVSILASTLLVFVCITFAAIIIKRAKVFAAIGIYYVTSSVVSTFTQFMAIIGASLLISGMIELQIQVGLAFGALVCLVGIAFFAIATALLYTFELWLIDKKLNLA